MTRVWMLVLSIVQVTSFLALTTCNAGAKDLVQDAIKRRFHRREANEFALLHKNKTPLTFRSQVTSAMATDPQDKKSLEDFYNSTNGARWINNSKWMIGDPCQDRWYGVYCSQNGRVLELTLVYNFLSGSIPNTIANLTQLQVLMLSSNNIQGGIPAGLFFLSSLRTLDLSINEITGTIPGSISMGNLTNLNLYFNKLLGKLPTIWNTPNLQILMLSSNFFTGSLPPAIGKLSKLVSLILSHNMLSGSLPEEYGNLNRLEAFGLIGNNFDNMTKIPESWSRLTNLTDVEMDGISGIFPLWIGNWSKIVNLVIVNGYLTGSFPISMCSLKKVRYLYIYNNSLSGPLPDCICNLPQSLNRLELSDNSFSGSIPECIGNLQNLTEIYLSRCNFSGNLPKSLGNIHHLNVIDFSSNSIVGSVPSSYAGLKGGTFMFTLSYNKLSSFDSGLEDFFDFLKGYTCALYENPWNCPLPSYIPINCQAACSECNTGSKHTSCSSCISDSSCGWCSQGPNCLEGSKSGPDTVYKCENSSWYYGSNCPTI